MSFYSTQLVYVLVRFSLARLLVWILIAYSSIFYMRTWFRMILDVPLPPEKTKSEPMTTPRFLFRVWSPNSDGKNSAKGFESLGRVTNSGRPRRLTDLRIEVVKQMVTHHVAWTSKWAYYDDILISFTSSLLFAIQHAIRKTNTSPPGYLPDTPDTCFLTIIDTTSLKQTFHKTTALVDQYKITDMDWADRQISFQRPQHEHEYLAEWSVNLRAAPNCSCTVNFGLLMKKGIDKVVPQFDVKYQKQLGMHVSLIRFLNHVRGQRYAVAASISFEELTAIYDLTACFSGRWQRLMRVWFMAMSQRKVDDQAVRDLLNRSWSADGIAPNYSESKRADRSQRTYLTDIIKSSFQNLQLSSKSESS